MLYPILIVEDDPKIANVVRVYLENAGYRVVTTEKGKAPFQFRPNPRAFLTVGLSLLRLGDVYIFS